MEKLKTTFTDDINCKNEKYVLNWVGKADALKVLQIPTTATLNPVPEEFINFDTTQTGNLEVLKVFQQPVRTKLSESLLICLTMQEVTVLFTLIAFEENKADYEKRVGDKSYNPDWAIVFKGEKKIYFVGETKGTGQELRGTEKMKIKCDKKHFRNFEEVKYKQVSKVSELNK